MVLITAVFLVHPRVSLLVFVCLVLTDINIIGYMAFWGVPVNSISMSCLVLAVGLTVDYSAHVAHAFLLQPGDDAAARVAAALRKVGAPIVSGALTTVLGIGFLEFGNSVTYFVFFKMFFITIVFGLLHGMLLLPVLLAWFGPPPSADAHAHAAESVLGHGAPERKDLLGGDDDE